MSSTDNHLQPENPAQDPEPESSRWQLLRDVLAFQFKLAMDGLRDVLLSPISLGAALLGIFTSSNDPAKYYRRLMDLGHKSDRWINLFNTYTDEESDNQQVSADVFIKRAEKIVLQEYEKGGVVRTVKDGTDKVTDRVIDHLQNRRDGRDS